MTTTGRRCASASPCAWARSRSDAEADLLAGSVFDAGGRLVVINEIVDDDDLDPVDAVRFFELLRELTSYGISVGLADEDQPQ